jgi:hypothetical protein
VVMGLVLVVAMLGAAALFATRVESGYEDTTALVAELEAAGIVCKKMILSPPEPTPELVDFGACQIDGATVNIHVYENGDPVGDHIESNLSARGDDPNYFTSLVAGSNWVVDTYSLETTKKIQEVLGGEIH